MTPEEPFPWLPLAAVLAQVGTVAGTPNAERVEAARQAAASWCQEQRRDLFAGGYPEGTFTPPPSVVAAATLATARLYARESSPAGVANYGEFAAHVLRNDPDIERMLGVGRYAKPAAR